MSQLDLTSLPLEQVRPFRGKLVFGDNKTPQLVFEAPDGRRCKVPNIWYNQPIDNRIIYYDFMARMVSERTVKTLEQEKVRDRAAAGYRTVAAYWRGKKADGQRFGTDYPGEWE